MSMEIFWQAETSQSSTASTLYTTIGVNDMSSRPKSLPLASKQLSIIVILALVILLPAVQFCVHSTHWPLLLFHGTVKAVPTFEPFIFNWSLGFCESGAVP